MEHQAFLAIISEVAATFAGFTGIVAVFRFRDAQWKSVELVQFVTMLRASLSALFLSLLPYLLFMLIDNTDFAWRTGCLIVTVVMGLNIYLFAVRGGTYRMVTIHNKIMFPLGILVVAANAVAVFDLLPANEVFLISVTWQLFVAANNFIILIMSDFSAAGTEAGEDELNQSGID